MLICLIWTSLYVCEGKCADNKVLMYAHTSLFIKSDPSQCWLTET